MVLHQRHVALEGTTQASSVGTVSPSPNLATLDSSLSAFTYIIDSGATGHVTRLRF